MKPRTTILATALLSLSCIAQAAVTQSPQFAADTPQLTESDTLLLAREANERERPGDRQRGRRASASDESLNVAGEPERRGRGGDGSGHRNVDDSNTEHLQLAGEPEKRGRGGDGSGHRNADDSAAEHLQLAREPENRGRGVRNG